MFQHQNIRCIRLQGSKLPILAGDFILGGQKGVGKEGGFELLQTMGLDSGVGDKVLVYRVAPQGAEPHLHLLRWVGTWLCPTTHTPAPFRLCVCVQFLDPSDLRSSSRF